MDFSIGQQQHLASFDKVKRQLAAQIQQAVSTYDQAAQAAPQAAAPYKTPSFVSQAYQQFLAQGQPTVATPWEDARNLVQDYATRLYNAQASRQTAARGYEQRQGKLTQYLQQKQQAAQQETAETFAETQQEAIQDLRRRGLSGAAADISQGYQSAAQQNQELANAQAIREQMQLLPQLAAETYGGQTAATQGALSTIGNVFGGQLYPSELGVNAARANAAGRSQYLQSLLGYQGTLAEGRIDWAKLREAARQQALTNAMQKLQLASEGALTRAQINAQYETVAAQIAGAKQAKFKQAWHAVLNPKNVTVSGGKTNMGPDPTSPIYGQFVDPSYVAASGLGATPATGSATGTTFHPEGVQRQAIEAAAKQRRQQQGYIY